MATRAQGKKIKKVIKKDAKIHLRQAIKIDPDFLDARYELGSLLLSEGELKVQKNNLIKLSNWTTTMLRVIINLPSLVQKTGKIKKLETCLKKRSP